MLLSSSALAQDINRADSVSATVQDSISATPEDTVEARSLRIFPWNFSKSIGFKEVTNDSLLRWQIWPSWGDWYARQANVVSYRQGTVSRIDAFLINGIEPRYQTLSWNGIDYNDPITGLVNFNEVAHHKLNSVISREGLFYENKIFFKNYYINEPITQLNFDESKFDYRNLEFVFARNLSKKTNLELSYWDRRDGGAFTRGEVQGSQVFGRVIHHLDNRWLLQAHYLRNEYNREESFGYQLPADLATFNFSRFATQANVFNGNSETLNSLWSFSLHKRSEEQGAEDFSIGVHRKRNDNRLTYSADSTFYEVKNIGVRAQKWLYLGPVNLELNANVDAYSTQDSSSISISSWEEWKTNAAASIDVLDQVKLKGSFEYFGRNSLSGSRLGVQLEANPLKRLNIRLDGAVGDKLPEIQHLYWQSRLYSGNAALGTESVVSIGGDVSYTILEGLDVGVTGRFRSIENGILLGLDSTFTSVPSYETLSGTVYSSYNVKHWEGSLSGSITQFSSKDAASNTLANRVDALRPTVLIKGSAYAKGTIYNGAAFVKAGLVGTFSPNLVETYSYVPDLGNWQLISNNAQNLSYFRLDLDFSVRVRSIFLVMRWENLLDGLAQTGYFESVGYPLQPRRLITGIRVLFKN